MHGLYRVNNVQARASKDGCFIQLKDHEDRVAKFLAPSMWSIIYNVEHKEDSFSGSTRKYVPADFYAIYETNGTEEIIGVRTGVIIYPNGAAILESVRQGEMAQVEWIYLLSAAGDSRYAEEVMMIEDDFVEMRDFYGIEIPDAHKRAIMSALTRHMNKLSSL